MEKKFLSLYETVFDRYKQGNGLLQGDVVKLVASYKTKESYKSLPANIQQRIDDLVERGKVIKVSRLFTPGEQKGSFGAQLAPATLADIHNEYAPGLWNSLVTLPTDLLERQDTGVNLAPTDDDNEYDDKVTKTPRKKQNNKDKKTDVETNKQTAQTLVDDENRNLTTKNVVPKYGANSYDDTKPSKFNGLKTESLESVYEKLLTENAG